MQQNKLGALLDEHYSDEFMDKIYANKKVVVDKNS